MLQFDTTQFLSFSTILVVDDSEVDTLITQKVLTRTGFAQQVITCNSVQQTIHYLEQTSTKDQPQILFLDVNMPYQSGYDFLDILDQKPSLLSLDCQIYMLSSSVSFIDEEKVRTYKRVKKFLHKPLNIALLTSLLKAA